MFLPRPSQVPKAMFALLLLPFPSSQGQSTLTGNLLLNPGAEQGNLSSWTASGPVGYIADNGGYEAGFADGFSPFFGSYQFVAGANPGTEGTLAQSVSLSSLSPAILAAVDAGSVRADISLWQKSLFQGGAPDYLRIRLEFEDGTDHLLGTFTGANLSYTSANPGSGDWHSYAASEMLPAGTRGITYYIDSFRGSNGGAWIDAFSDEHQLMLSSIPEPPVGPTLAATTLAAWVLFRRFRR